MPTVDYAAPRNEQPVEDAPKSPQQQIDELKAEVARARQDIEDQRDALEEAEKKLTETESRLTQFEQSYDESAAAIAEYEQAYPGVAKKYDDIKCYITREAKAAREKLGERGVARVDAAVKEVDDAINQLAQASAQAGKAKQASEAKYEEAQRARDAAQAAFDAAKQAKADIEARVGDLGTLRDQVDAIDFKAQPATAYWIASELDRAVTATKIPDVDAFRTMLDEKWNGLQDASKPLADLKATAERDGEAATTARQQWDDAVAGRKQALRDTLAPIDADVTSSAEAPAAPASRRESSDLVAG